MARLPKGMKEELYNFYEQTGNHMNAVSGFAQMYTQLVSPNFSAIENEADKAWNFLEKFRLEPEKAEKEEFLKALKESHSTLVAMNKKIDALDKHELLEDIKKTSVEAIEKIAKMKERIEKLK